MSTGDHPRPRRSAPTPSTDHSVGDLSPPASPRRRQGPRQFRRLLRRDHHRRLPEVSSSSRGPGGQHHDGHEQRDGHLKSPDFFDLENFPTLTLKSTKITIKSDSEFTLTGDLTIRGITKSVDFNVEYLGSGRTYPRHHGHRLRGDRRGLTGATSMSASTERSRTAPSWSATRSRSRSRSKPARPTERHCSQSTHTRLNGRALLRAPALPRARTPRAAWPMWRTATRCTCSPTSARSLVAELPALDPATAYALAIDLGTGGPKVALVAADGHIAAHGFATVDLRCSARAARRSSGPPNGGTRSAARPARRWPRAASHPRTSSVSPATARGRGPWRSGPTARRSATR